MEKVTDCAKPGNDTIGDLHHGRTQSTNNRKNAGMITLTKILKLRYL
jgi:hypothetical protein